jgi:hypothetical protein
MATFQDDDGLSLTTLAATLNTTLDDIASTSTRTIETSAILVPIS